MIKLFEQFNNEQEIHDICKKYKIKNYTINPDGSVDVNSNVDLSDMNLTELPLKFNKVSGYFDCGNNQLTTLEGCPKEVDNSFYCYNNKLTSLKGCPEIVGGVFHCHNNKLTSLKGCPKEVGGFYCYGNQLTSLEGSPMIIDGNLYIEHNPISIIDSSIEIKGEISIDDTNFDNKIKSLSQDKLKILFEHGVDYDIFRKDGSINDYRLDGMFKDFDM